MEHSDLNRKHDKPSKPSILDLVNKFLKTGSVLDASCRSRQKTGRSTAKMMQLDAQYCKSPNAGQNTNDKVKRSTFSAPHFVERLISFLSRYHKTKDQGSRQQARITFCNWISDQIEQKPAFINNIWL